MEDHAIRLLEPVTTAAEHYQLPTAKRITGDPQQSLWPQYSDPSGRFFTGIWRSEVGKWRISYTEEEYCHILEGISTITRDGGEATTVSAGARFVIPRGFVGTWEVVEPTRKIYVIYEAG